MTDEKIAEGFAVGPKAPKKWLATKIAGILIILALGAYLIVTDLSQGRAIKTLQTGVDQLTTYLAAGIQVNIFPSGQYLEQRLTQASSTK